MLRPAGRKAPPDLSKGTGRQFLDCGPGRAPLSRTWSHSPAHLASPRVGQCQPAGGTSRHKLPLRDAPSHAPPTCPVDTARPVTSRPDPQPQTCGLSSPRGLPGIGKEARKAPTPWGRAHFTGYSELKTRRTQLSPAMCGAVQGWAWGASAAPGRGAPGRPGRCRCIHWFQQLFVNARPRPRLPRCPAPSRAAHTGRKRYTSA